MNIKEIYQQGFDAGYELAKSERKMLSVELVDIKAKRNHPKKLENLYSTYSKEDEDFLKENYPVKPTRWIARKLGRTVTALQQRASMLGLKKNGNSVVVEKSGVA